MKTLVQNFSKQLAEALVIGSSAKFTKANQKINNVLICGLGGSGIGGSILTELVVDKCSVPVNVTKGYFIPAYVNENTLVIVSSYSGNTEETIYCMQQAIDKKAKLSAITSGGKIAELAAENNIDRVAIPGGMPPRACVGYSLIQLFYVLNFHQLIDDGFKKDFEAAIRLLNGRETAIVSEAQRIVEKIKDKIPVIYATTNNEGVTIRFRQQLNENAKILCWHHVIPEMNHNELVGWTQKNENLAVLIFLNKDEYARNMARVKINTEVIKKYADSITEVYSEGATPIEKAIYFIHLGDWVSVLLAEARGVDAVEVNVITQLKSKLANI